MTTVNCVILNWRTAEMSLRSCQAAMAAMEGIDGAITLVDNDSQDGSFEAMQEAARDWPRVQVIQSGRNGGYGSGNNVGIRAGLPDGSRPDYVYILNSDAFPEPDAIHTLLAHLQANPQTGCAGSLIYGEDGERHYTTFNFPTVISEFVSAADTGPISKLFKNHVIAPTPPTTTGPVPYCAGMSLLMRQSVLDQVGLFDETFFLYFEETDLCRRIRNGGHGIDFVAESRVMHIGSVSTGMKTWQRVPDYWFKSRHYYFTKNHGGLYARAATVAHVLGLGVHGLRVLLQRKTPHNPPYFLRDLLRHSL